MSNTVVQDIMYFTVLIFTLLGLHLVNSEKCEAAKTLLASNSVCFEAFESVELNTTTADGPLCTRMCRRLIKKVLFNCDMDHVSYS